MLKIDKKLPPYLQTLGITRVADITGLDCIGIPTALAIRPNGKHISVSMGKGLTQESAYISAVMESMEIFHLENPPAISFEDIYSENCVSPALFNTGFFLKNNWDHEVLAWTKAFHLFDNKEIYIPHALTNLDSTVPCAHRAFFDVSTNGMGAGENVDDAICHALCEVIERDSLARFALLPDHIRQTKLFNQSEISSTNHDLIEKFLRQNMSLKIWDITSHFNIPTFHCVCHDPNPFRLQGIFRGTGTHWNADIALIRALLEVAQSRLALISGSRDDIFAEQYEIKVLCHPREDGDPFKINHTERGNGKIDSSILKSQILTRLYENNINDVFMVIHTKPELNIPVVQVFIPGLMR